MSSSQAKLNTDTVHTPFGLYNAHVDSNNGVTITVHPPSGDSCWPTIGDWRTAFPCTGNTDSSIGSGPTNGSFSVYDPGAGLNATGEFSATSITVTGPICDIPISETTAQASGSNYNVWGGTNFGSETNSDPGWDDNGLYGGVASPPTGAWSMTLNALNGGTSNFYTSGATNNIQESNAGAASDTCWYSGSAVPQATALTTDYWDVQAGDVWGYDFVGWYINSLGNTVYYYRGTGNYNGFSGTNRAPCGYAYRQQMAFKCPVEWGLLQLRQSQHTARQHLLIECGLEPGKRDGNQKSILRG